MPEHSYFRSGVFVLLAVFQIGCSGLAALDSGNGPSLTLATTDHGQAGGDRFVQEREFGTSSARAFASVMTVLADLGFRPTHADATSGFITASGSGRERISLEIGGLARSSDQTSVSVFIDRLSDDSTAVRAIFARSRTRSTKGESLQRTVREAEPYGNFFSALQAEIDRRNERLARRPSPIDEEAFEQDSVMGSEDPPPSASDNIDLVAGWGPFALFATVQAQHQRTVFAIKFPPPTLGDRITGRDMEGAYKTRGNARWMTLINLSRRERIEERSPLRQGDTGRLRTKRRRH